KEMRRCWANSAHTAVTTKSCISDFDCFGRCSADQGFLCVVDADCQAGATAPAFSTTNATGLLAAAPNSRLICGNTSNNVPASPIACNSIGWLSFNSSDFSDTTFAPSPPAPANTKVGVSYNTNHLAHNPNYPVADRGAHELSGWARFMTPNLTDNPNYSNSGWVSLRGSATGASPSSKLFACRDCIGGPGGMATGGNSQMNCSFCQDEGNQSCVTSDTVDGLGNKVANCHYLCEDGTTPCVTNNQCGGIGSGQCRAPGYCTGDGTTACASDGQCTNNGRCATGAICSTSGSSCDAYGVNLDTETGKFYGNAWSQDFGWLGFENVSQGGSRILQTRLGDIYAREQIGNNAIPVPSSQQNCNGTYLIISSSTITNFCSVLGSAVVGGINPLQPNSSSISFPSEGNVFQNILGRFDLKGLEKVTDTSDPNRPKNKYGIEVRTMSAASGDVSAWLKSQAAGQGNLIPSGPNFILGGRVYKIGDDNTHGTYTLDSLISFANSNSVAVSGSGVLIVNGDLVINVTEDALTYASGNVNDLRKLASLTVVVRGNLTLSNSVKNLVGAYYVTDNPATTQVEGVFDTASDPTSNNGTQLILRGLVIARQFLFHRQTAGTIDNPTPSELFIYDGRLQSNPLPGMTDFVNALPTAVTPGP
ncbi:MAG: hypothetical protein HY975_02795, partial [Candidatus Kerfeldbacteria bacterium]|nr:hypothetical protein [Candidatus Kerfeldbacteria bacterium]